MAVVPRVRSEGLLYLSKICSRVNLYAVTVRARQYARTLTFVGEENQLVVGAMFANDDSKMRDPLVCDSPRRRDAAVANAGAVCIERPPNGSGAHGAGACTRRRVGAKLYCMVFSLIFEVAWSL